MILVNNQLDAKFFTYVYFYSLHVSGSHVPIIRRNIVSMRHLVYVTLHTVTVVYRAHVLQRGYMKHFASSWLFTRNKQILIMELKFAVQFADNQ